MKLNYFFILIIVLFSNSGMAQQQDTAALLSFSKRALRMVDLGQLDSATLLVDSVSKLSIRSQDSLGYFYSEYIRGNILIERFKYSAAKISFQKAKNGFEKTNDIGTLAIISTQLAALAGREEDYAEALRLFYQNLPLLEKLKDTLTLVNTINSVATIYFLQNNYEESLRVYREALLLADKKGLESLAAKTKSDIGGVYLKEGKYDSATAWCNAALIIYRKINDKWGIAYAISVLGMTLEKEGELLQAARQPSARKYKLLEALRMYNNMHEILVSLMDTDGIAESNLYLGNLYRHLGNADSARFHFDSCIYYSRLISKKQYPRDAYLALYKIDSANSDYRGALLNFKQFILYRDSVVNEESLRKSDQYKASYELDKKENELKLLFAENELKTVLAQKEGQRKNFALAGIVAVLLVGGYSFYRFRKKKQIQNRQNLMNERLRISRELHDEVGATLSGVSMYSHLTKTQLQSSNLAGVENSLNVMQESSAQMVNKLNDIVWLMNPEQGSLQKLIQRLEEYARNMASVKNIDVKIHTPLHLNEHLLPIEKRRNIYLFCKEAINNAVKYSEGTMLELKMIEDKDTIAFSVRDNGKGFDEETVRRGTGLDSMQQRADDIGAKLSLCSKQTEGTTISMEIKITRWGII
jgi:signal transduction histidine kinase